MIMLNVEAVKTRDRGDDAVLLVFFRVGFMAPIDNLFSVVVQRAEHLEPVPASRHEWWPLCRLLFVFL
jgi:hypothetical protein